MATAQVSAPSAEDLKLYALQQKYAEEAAKRLRPEFNDQFVPLAKAGGERLRELGNDPWVDHDALNAKPLIQDGARYKYVVAGSGFGGIVLVVRLMQAGLVKGPSDVLIVDNAGGFGGTWYWNRYPGLHCDVESYCYLPMLEETGFVPKFKYSPGFEIREYANLLATKWELHDKALFRTSIGSARWDQEASLWNLHVTEHRGPSEPSRNLVIRADWFLSCTGIFPRPQIPKIPGLDTFSGPMFHTSRWDYSVTGGSPEDPQLTKLAGKRVGIIGTGATAIQAGPCLARHAKELFVFQRTPSNVWPRGQRPTDPQEWKDKIATHPGWQLERNMNLNKFLTNAAEDGDVNLVGDAWTDFRSYCLGVGSPRWGYIEPTPEKIGEHVARLMRMDMPYTEAGRARVDAVVRDPAVAAKLKGWYPVWCKRPTFNDEYLDMYNQPHVKLVDTDGRGVDSVTERGVVVAGTEYPLDVLILSTGYEGPASGGGNPSFRSGIEIIGKDGRSLHEKWETQGATSLHGFSTNGFPNFLWQSPIQGSSAVNWLYSVDVWTRHFVGLLSDLESRAGTGKRPVAENSVQAEEEWAGEIMRHAPHFAGFMGCTPGYINNEGALAVMPQDPAEMMKKARLGTWSFGLESFTKVLDKAREGGNPGFQLTAVPA